MRSGLSFRWAATVVHLVAAFEFVAMGARMQPADLTYRGAFRLPDTHEMPEEESWNWSTWCSAMAYYPNGDPSGPSDGYPGSIFGVGNDLHQYVSEIDIPVPVVSAGKNLDDLNRAQTLQVFADIRGGIYPELEMPRVGLAYLSAQGAQSSGNSSAWANHLMARHHRVTRRCVRTPIPIGAYGGSSAGTMSAATAYSRSQAWAGVYTPENIITGRA